MKWLCILVLAVGLTLVPGENIPATPDKFFTDYTSTLDTERGAALNEQLAQFERDTQIQFLVAVFGPLDTASSLEDYCNRVFRTWKPGQKGHNNGLVFFLFKDARKMRLEIGYGLEPILPDAVAKRILDEVGKPLFKQGDFIGGTEAIVKAVITKLSKQPAAPVSATLQQPDETYGFIIVGLLVLVSSVSVVIFVLKRRRQTLAWCADTSPIVEKPEDALSQALKTEAVLSCVVKPATRPVPKPVIDKSRVAKYECVKHTRTSYAAPIAAAAVTGAVVLTAAQLRQKTKADELEAQRRRKREANENEARRKRREDDEEEERHRKTCNDDNNASSSSYSSSSSSSYDLDSSSSDYSSGGGDSGGGGASSDF